MIKFYFKTIFFVTVFIVFYLAVVPNDSVLFDFGLGDKFNHFLAFFTLSLLLNRSSSSYEKRLRNVIVLTLFGAFIEMIQLFIQYRSASFYDLLADIFGILVFQAFYSLYRLIRYRR
ncbi:MAG: VanZ family protein [Epsilonproteobacteria bacterium]|nr:VanZ family protein [Campylobacterota bacterium]